MIAMMLVAIATARADEPGTTPHETEESTEGDPLAAARQTLGRAEKALGGAAGLHRRVSGLEQVQATHNTRIAELERRLDELEQRGGSDAEIAAVKAELAELLRKGEAAAVRAEDAAGRAEAAAVRATIAADRAQVAPSSEGTITLASAPVPDRDAPDTRVYGAVGAGASWLFRQASYVESDVEEVTVRVAETSELSSGVLPALVEVGMAGFDAKGRMNVGARGELAYNVGGGYHLVVEGVVGGFVEKTHAVRFEGFAGFQREMIPVDGGSAYEEWRYNVGVGAEFVFAHDANDRGRVGLLLLGRLLPANDLNDSNAGETALLLRAKF